MCCHSGQSHVHSFDGGYWLRHKQEARVEYFFLMIVSDSKEHKGLV